MFLINDEIYIIRKLPLIGPVYSPLKGVLTRFLSEVAHIYRKKKKSLETSCNSDDQNTFCI